MPTREGGWSPRCERVWASFWASPKATEFDPNCHAHLVERMLVLENDFDEAGPDIRLKVGLSAEIRAIARTLLMNPLDCRDGRSDSGPEPVPRRSKASKRIDPRR